MRTLLVILTMLWGGAAWAAGVSTSIPASKVVNKSKFWRAVMTEFYGQYNKRRKCWVGKSAGKRFCMRPHKLRTVSVGSTNQHYLVIGGYKINKGGGRDQCHACSGNMGLVILEDGSKKLRLVAKNALFEERGSWGQLPGEDAFELREIGSKGAYGWTISSGYSGQGYTTESYEVLGVVGDRFRTLARFPKGWDDQGNCDGGKNISSGKGCTDVDVQMTFIPDNGSTFYPVLLEMSGSEEGKPYSKKFRVNFDPASLAYEKPKGLPEGF